MFHNVILVLQTKWCTRQLHDLSHGHTGFVARTNILHVFPHLILYVGLIFQMNSSSNSYLFQSGSSLPTVIMVVNILILVVWCWLCVTVSGYTLQMWLTAGCGKAGARCQTLLILTPKNVWSIWHLIGQIKIILRLMMLLTSQAKSLRRYSEYLIYCLVLICIALFCSLIKFPNPNYFLYGRNAVCSTVFLTFIILPV